jgi:ribosome biogenesis ATPase
VLCKNLRLSGDFDFKKISKMTPGFVGADLQALTSAAGVIAMKRLIEELLQEISPEAMQTDEPLASPQDELPPPMSKLHAFLQEDKGSIAEDKLQNLFITYDDFLAAVPKVQPSAKREGFATVPDVTWDNVGALSEIRQELNMAIVQQVKYPELYAQVGITAPSGVLLWGPPGCGKTLLAKAVANESRANFISIKGPELLNKVYLMFGLLI